MAQRTSPAPLCRSSLRIIRHWETHFTPSKRWLTASAVRYGSGKLPAFQPSASEELSQLLDSIRSKIIIPAYLSKAQQKLIYKSKNRTLFQNEPFSVKIGPQDDEDTVLLEPIDRIKDVPKTWRSIRRAIQLMSTEESISSHPTTQDAALDPNSELAVEDTARPADRWANLLPLLDGIHTARGVLKTWQWEYLIRFVGKTGATHVLLSAAQQSERTGLYLFNVRVVREILWACRTRADLGRWTLESGTKALSFAEQFTRLMEDPRQSAEAKRLINRTGHVDSPPPGQEPDVIGAVLELAACRAENLVASGAPEEAISDAKSVVAKYVARLVPNLKKLHSEQQHPCDIAKGSLRPPAAAADYELLRWVPVLNGLQAAERVLGSELASRDVISRTTSHLERVVAEKSQAVMANVGGNEGGKRLGLMWANERGSV